MVRPPLKVIGYWRGPGTDPSLPYPHVQVGDSSLSLDAETIADYLDRGFLHTSFMGYSICRICGQQNGALELTDGTFLWPEGLSHYIRAHHVRLPTAVEEGILSHIDDLESRGRDVSFWKSQTSNDS